MSTAALLFAITLTSTATASNSDSILSCISCPCGSSNQNYTHCINGLLLEDFSCDRWSHCQTCKANSTFCLSCSPDRFGPTCSEISNDITGRKRQDHQETFNHPRYPRQSSSGRHSQTRCLNNGIISHGQVVVILPGDGSSQPEDDDFDFPYGTTLKYACDDGFTLVGKDTLRCGSNGFWTESFPECIGETPTSQETCEHPGVNVNGRINNPLQRRSQNFPVGTELTFVCNDGYDTEGPTVLACLSNGQWTSLPPKCQRKLAVEVVELPCRHPGVVLNSVFNGDLNKSSFPVGTAVTFRCVEGTQRRGPMTIYCQSNGMWSEPPPSCETTRNGRR